MKEIFFLFNFSLVCEVSYVTPAGTPLSFRKFFKFQVLQPLDIKTKFYNAEVSFKKVPQELLGIGLSLSVPENFW